MRKRKPHSLETRMKISKSHLGKKVSEITKQRMREAHKGNFLEKASGWRGGIQHTNGYVYLMSRSHPNANCRGYVAEHRLVMEKTIGRYLLPEETVHHKNGERSDNRQENLELWSCNHPVGQKVEDLLVWARGIIKLYSDLALIK